MPFRFLLGKCCRSHCFVIHYGETHLPPSHGFLEGKAATTNPSEYETLGSYCETVLRDRKVVQDGHIITAGAVSSSLDLGLYLCELWAGREARLEIQKKMDYRCYE